MSSTSITSLPTEQATTTKPASRLLTLYGAPTPIRTEYVTRQHPDCAHPRKQVQCPTCKTWSDLTHNSYCYTCAIWLAYVIPANVEVA